MLLVWNPARVGLFAAIGEFFRSQPKPAKEPAVKLDLGIQPQTESPSRPRRQVVPAVRTGRQRGSRIPKARARSRRWCARGNRRLLSLFFVPLIAEAQVTAQFQFFNPGCQLKRTARSRYHCRIFRYLRLNTLSVFLRQDAFANQSIDERLVVCKYPTGG